MEHTAFFGANGITMCMDRDVDFDLFLQVDADQIQVQHFDPKRIPLHLADQRCFVNVAFQLHHLAMVPQQNLDVIEWYSEVLVRLSVPIQKPRVRGRRGGAADKPTSLFPRVW